MSSTQKFFAALGLNSNDSVAIKQLASKTGIQVERLRHYDAKNILPSGSDLEKICLVRNITQTELMLLMGCLDRKILSAIQKYAGAIYELIKDDIQPFHSFGKKPNLKLETGCGQLYQGDCLELMREMESESVDLVFADPPFNLNKEYPSGIDDALKTSEYLNWCEAWSEECIRLLKPGGNLLFWNLPRWNTWMSEFLNKRLTFRHWIATDIKYRLPIVGRLYPSHYSLIYYCKGERPKTFHPDRLPLETCTNCHQELRDYGGYKHKMNPKGVNLTDVWYDIPPVRHKRYKQRDGANELSIRLMDRIIEMASDEGDVVFDPFGGAGTTYVVAEMKRRKWIGIEIGPVDSILNRFNDLEEEQEYLKRIREDYNCLFTVRTLKARVEKDLWTAESVRAKLANTDKDNQLSSTVQAELNLQV